MRSVRGWTVWAVVVAGWSGGLACGGEEGPSAGKREARSELVRNLVASRQAAPSPEALEEQRRLQEGDTSLPEGEELEVDTPARLSGTVEAVEDGVLLVLEAGEVVREVRVDEATRYVEDGEVVRRGAVREGTQVRVFYDLKRGDAVAREVEVLHATESDD